MIRKALRVVAVILLVSATVGSQDQSVLVGRYSVKGLQEFEPVTPVLAKLVEQASELQLTQKNLSRKANHLYVCKVEKYQQAGYTWMLARVYWKEAQAIILWEPGTAGDARVYELAWSRRFLRLDRDVVATEADIRGSTYRITRQEAKATIQECVQDGDLYVIPALKKDR
jgi:hypothetical protein